MTLNSHRRRLCLVRHRPRHRLHRPRHPRRCPQRRTRCIAVGFSCIADLLSCVFGPPQRLMATTAIVRNPLATKAHSQQASAPGPSWYSTRKLSSAKRAHSPEPQADVPGNSSKRAKAVPDASAAALALDRKARRVEREQEFREKYGRAFPNWVFYFDLETMAPAVKDALGKRVAQMGAVVF